jgi:hypothetical protein
MFIRSVFVFVFTGVAATFAWTGAAQAQSFEANAFEAEDQNPIGKFTTATEVKHILDATRAQWIAVRPWDGQDLLYFTNLLSWRCGIHEIRYAVNGGSKQILTTEPCYADESAPNALKMDGGVFPYVAFPENSIVTIEVQILYDDLSEGGEQYDRAAVQIN